MATYPFGKLSYCGVHGLKEAPADEQELLPPVKATIINNPSHLNQEIGIHTPPDNTTEVQEDKLNGRE